jgi:hypothetical protein
MIIETNNPKPKYGEVTPSWKTELITLKNKTVVKATIKAGGMTVIAYSDEIADPTSASIEEYRMQAVLRAMNLVPNS